MSELLYEGKYYSFYQDQSGTEYIQGGDEAIVVPVTDSGEVILAIEPSAAYGGTTLVLNVHKAGSLYAIFAQI